VEKKFIANVAKKAVTTAAELSPEHTTSNVLLATVASKNLNLAEFALSSLVKLV
jgi:hypothetical protein